MPAVSTLQRGRPRSFDRDVALRQAMDLFWDRGYEGASMSQLVDAMGIGSPSIYAAFGSKEDLFREAVELYLSTQIEPAWSAMDKTVDLRSAIRTMFMITLDAFVATGASRGCLLVLGSAPLGGDSSVRSFLRNKRVKYEARLEARLKRGIADGDISPDSNPATLASCLLAFAGGIAIQSVDGASNEELRDSIELFCEQIFR